MPHTHEHSGCADAPKPPRFSEARSYLKILLITFLICAVQMTGAFISGSLSLWSDTVHVLSDGAGALISMSVAYLVVARSLNHEREREVRRFWMKVSAVLLLGALAWILYESWERFQHPSHVTGWVVTLSAVLGALGNWWQHSQMPHQHNETAHLQRLHILSDLYSSIAVIISGILISLTAWRFIDPLFSTGIVLWIGWHTVKAFVGNESHDHFHSH